MSTLSHIMPCRGKESENMQQKSLLKWSHAESTRYPHHIWMSLFCEQQSICAAVSEEASLIKGQNSSLCSEHIWTCTSQTPNIQSTTHDHILCQEKLCSPETCLNMCNWGRQTLAQSCRVPSELRLTTQS